MDRMTAGVSWHVDSLRFAQATFEITYTLLKTPTKSKNYLTFKITYFQPEQILQQSFKPSSHIPVVLEGGLECSFSKNGNNFYSVTPCVCENQGGLHSQATFLNCK
jgi:hypothetical protein